jgi:BirA family transcriptional regulator, biotin operon repressor / biotin---[acetyl-CoA-carboxylase] ligase
MTETTPRLASFYRLVALEAVDSTNAEVQRRAAAGAPEGTLVWARRQTAGRGRRGRAWQSPPGNLAFSLLLRPAVAPATAATLGFVAGLALAAAVDEALPAGRSSELKWPNDLLVDGRKMAGILLEAAATGGQGLDHVVLGVGVNIVAYPEDLPYPATGLAASGGHGDAASLLGGFAGHFLPLYRTWEQDGFAALRAAWLARARGFGGPVTVRLDRATLEGRFAALDGQGALLLEMADGARHTVTAGDLYFAGPG